MAYKVYKHFKKYSVVKDTWSEKFYVVDVAQGTTLYGSWTASNAAHVASELDTGVMDPSMWDKPYNDDYMQPIDMPKSLQVKQAKMQKQAQTQASAAVSKPIGSRALSIVDVADKGAFKVVQMDDGTLGVLVPSTGQSKMGMTSKSGATLSGKSMSGKYAEERLAAIGVDPGHDAVETLLDLYEGRVRDMYGRAYQELAAKQAPMMERFEAGKARMIEKLDAGEITHRQLSQWYASQAAAVQANQQLIDSMAAVLERADRTAMSMLNGYLPAAYAENYNFETFRIERDAGIDTSFSLYSPNAVAEILKDPEALMVPHVDNAYDHAWCRRKVSQCITQSILQGDSVPNAAKRLAYITGMGANSAMRAARTALTGAENLGRIDAGRRARAMGIDLRKQWVATVDARTRNSHRQIDRETVDLDEKFSNGCGYPGDPSAAGHEVWNCRCAMRHVLPGHEYDDLPSRSREGMDYEEWKDAKKPSLEAKKDKLSAELESLEAQKSSIMSALPDDEHFDQLFGPNSYDGASLSQWADKQDKIQAAKKKYNDKLDTIVSHMGDHGWESPDWERRYDRYIKRLDRLEDYDRRGKAYHEAQEAVREQLDAIEARRKEIKKELYGLQGNGGPFSEERLKAARRFATSEEADSALRDLSGRAWREATEAEKRAINSYTGGSYREYNQPLNGFQRGKYVGVGDADIDFHGKGDSIRAMTSIIERSVTDEDMWVRRGVSGRTMATFFDLEAGTDLTHMSDEALQQLVGMSNRIGSFQSCGTTERTGFTGTSVNLNIFVPSGSEAFYAEPISKFGDGAGLSWDGISGQPSFGSELETILQRGGSYTCTRIDRRGSGLDMDLELHPEDGYWKFQQDD